MVSNYPIISYERWHAKKQASSLKQRTKCCVDWIKYDPLPLRLQQIAPSKSSLGVRPSFKNSQPRWSNWNADQHQRVPSRERPDSRGISKFRNIWRTADSIQGSCISPLMSASPMHNNSKLVNFHLASRMVLIQRPSVSQILRNKNVSLLNQAKFSSWAKFAYLCLNPQTQSYLPSCHWKVQV